MTTRLISHTETRQLAICEAAWDLRYGGVLAGSALKPLSATPRIREGRAWGRAVATWHETDSPHDSGIALFQALSDDAREQRDAGVYDQDAHGLMADRLAAILREYRATAERLPITSPEHEIVVPIQSRTGRRASSRYRLQCFYDGIHTDDNGRVWIVEFKLRSTLSTIEQLALDRQGRRYAWAWRQHTGADVAGVIYDERLNEAPKPPKVLASGKVSTDKRQLTTPDLYEQACVEHGQDPDPDTLTALAARRWQQREHIIFRPGELDETGAELVALAQRIRDLEAGRMPIRTPHPAHCRSCGFRDICANPTDTDLVDALYERVPAKRHRTINEEAA